ncbi:MAG: hypothetical protein Q4F57_04685 [Weeksellaceae bacterium]|nr:hypothetical protein [Weeksellaceae bacterium]
MAMIEDCLHHNFHCFYFFWGAPVSTGPGFTLVLRRIFAAKHVGLWFSAGATASTRITPVLQSKNVRRTTAAIPAPSAFGGRADFSYLGKLLSMYDFQNFRDLPSFG